MKQTKNERRVSYRSSDSSGNPIPCIFIQGKFLKLYDFSVGDKVNIFYSNGLVNISKITNSQPDDNMATMAVN